MASLPRSSGRWERRREERPRLSREGRELREAGREVRRLQPTSSTWPLTAQSHSAEN